MRVIDRVMERARSPQFGCRSDADVARLLGITPQRLGNWFTRDVPSGQYRRIARKLGWSVNDLLGETRNPIEGSPGEPGPQYDPKPTVTRVPLLLWEQVPLWLEGGKVDGAKRPPPRYVAVSEDEYDVGPRGFAVKHTGDAMNMPDGSMMIVDPDVDPGHKSVVVARIDGRLLVRRLWFDGPTAQLRADNPAYPLLPFPDDALIVGVVVTYSARP